MKALRTPGGIAVVALFIGVLAAVRLLAVFDWDPTVFTAFGEDATATTAYAEERLDREVLTRPRQGHDGKFFFVQAHDPWLGSPEENAEILDRPIYRAQRMFYPVLAGGAGLFPSEMIVWALPIVNVVMLAVGSWAVAAIARRHGAPAWVGLAFALNIGLLSELFIDGAGITAFALVALGAWALEEGHFAFAAGALTGAVLTREVMAAFVAFLAVFWLIRKRKVPWSVAVPPAIAVVGWAVYVRLRIDPVDSVDQVRELTLVPFSGAVDAWTSGNGNALDLLVVGVFVVLIFLVPFRAWRSEVFLSWGAVGFAVLAPFLTVFVWQKSFDISRALAPLVTVFVVELFIARVRRHRGLEGIGEQAIASIRG